MNVFFLSTDPMLCARAHCDKHCCKQIIEYTQILSTAHRVLDGELAVVKWADLRIRKGNLVEVKHTTKLYLFPGETWELESDDAYLKKAKSGPTEQRKIVVTAQPRMYRATHTNHPCSKWVRETVGNYHYLSSVLNWLLLEYEHRYGKIHATTRYRGTLDRHPVNIPAGELTPPPLVMPAEYRVEDAVVAYQNLYIYNKARFARWTNRRPPGWFLERSTQYDETHFARTNGLVA